MKKSELSQGNDYVFWLEYNWTTMYLLRIICHDLRKNLIENL